MTKVKQKFRWNKQSQSLSLTEKVLIYICEIKDSYFHLLCDYEKNRKNVTISWQREKWNNVKFSNNPKRARQEKKEHKTSRRI